MKHFPEEGTHELHLQGDKRSQQESGKRRKRKAGALGAAPAKARSTRGRGTGVTENAMLRRGRECECTQVGRQLTGAPSARLEGLNRRVLQAAPGGKNPARQASPAGGGGGKRGGGGGGGGAGPEENGASGLRLFSWCCHRIFPTQSFSLLVLSLQAGRVNYPIQGCQRLLATKLFQENTHTRTHP